MRKKLIEVALPLDAINAAASREKSIRHGHPSTLHLWWARRPLAAARAVIFAQMVDDPSEYIDVLLSDAGKPFRLAPDIGGIGFKTADAITMKLGIAKTTMIRVRPGIGYGYCQVEADGRF